MREGEECRETMRRVPVKAPEEMLSWYVVWRVGCKLPVPMTFVSVGDAKQWIRGQEKHDEPGAKRLKVLRARVMGRAG